MTMTTEPTLFDFVDAPNSPVDQMQTVDASPGRVLQDKCIGMALRTSSFSASRGFDAATKDQVAAALGANKNAITGGKLLYDAGHPAIKKARAALNRVATFWRANTLPLADAFPGGEGKVAGIRLCEKARYEEVDRSLLALAEEVKAAERELNAQRDSILEASRLRLGRQFSPHDYPDEFQLSVFWYPVEVNPPSYLERLAPDAYRRAVRAVTDQMERSLEEAVGDFVGEFHAIVSRWATVLGPVVRVYPPVGHELVKAYGCEVSDIVTSSDDPSVGAGTLNLTLGVPVSKVGSAGHLSLADAYELVNALSARGWVTPEAREQSHKDLDALREASRRRNARIDLAVTGIPESAYRDLRPQEQPDERRTFKSSTVEALVDKVTEFRNLADAMQASPELRALVDQAAAQLDGMSADEATKELRDSSRYRRQTHEAMRQLNRQLEQQVELIDERRARRRVIRM